MISQELPVAIIGAGPVGLAAAAHLVKRRVPVRLYESGNRVGENVRSWGHVRLFSPWRFNTDPVAAELLRQHGWQAPSADKMPTGRELIDAYLEPLASAPSMAGIVRTGQRVKSIARKGLGKLASRDRARHPFALSIAAGGEHRLELAGAIIDASGTWQNPNPLAASGIMAVGEASLAAQIDYGIPDVLGVKRSSFAGRRVLVVGGGHSAANVLLDLAQLADENGQAELIWAVRATDLTRTFGGGSADHLPARGRLGADLKRLAESGMLTLITGLAAEAVNKSEDGLIVTGLRGAEPATLPPVDRIVVATGQRPDLVMTRELRLELDPWIESSRSLGPLIDPNLHSCGSVPPHGYKELAHPEPGYFAVGIKSYGRAPTFLMTTGYEQVRSIAAHLAGDHAEADAVHLVLPETGVCTLAPPLASVGSGCCGGPAPASVDACCVADATAKAAGKAGCGCSEAA